MRNSIELVSDGFSKNYGIVEKENDVQNEKPPISRTPEEYVIKMNYSILLILLKHIQITQELLT